MFGGFEFKVKVSGGFVKAGAAVAVLGLNVGVGQAGCVGFDDRLLDFAVVVWAEGVGCHLFQGLAISSFQRSLSAFVVFSTSLVS
jgi:hypothetical protein